MPITPAQIAAAAAVQQAASQDASPQVRLVAGPGSGKSAAIEQRVKWLLDQGVNPQAICAVSFTRASSGDLRRRVHEFCTSHGHGAADTVRISTLHALGLRLLRVAGHLATYPVDPLVLDTWETAEIFDSEFGLAHGHDKGRRVAIRREHEAFWSTGSWTPANYIPPDPPVSAAERAQFSAFHGPRTQTYACVLPGEIIRKCVELLEAGLIDPVALLHIEHLIVDEFQDLNPLDLQFVGHFIRLGVRVFVAGDDDQSVYSFRFATPTGIQEFPATYPGTGEHELAACFRCTPRVLAASTTLMAAFSAPGRIPKHQHSLYGASAPPVGGTVLRLRFANALVEATAIASSCRDLITAGMNPRDILILLNNQRAISSALTDQLTASGVPFEHPRDEGFLDSKVGRLTLALVRITCDSNDYVSLRAMTGLRNGVGIKTCYGICETVIANNLNFRNIFFNPLPPGVFSKAQEKAVNNVRVTCATLAGWTAADTVDSRAAAIHGIVEEYLGAAAAAEWDTFHASLPTDMSIEELRDFLWADTDEQQTAVLEAAFKRLGKPIPAGGILPARVRIMTMHGAKGLSAHLVFIPGLEEEIFPGPWRNAYPGLVLEAARLLYVSITRARAACVMSFAPRRTVNGTYSLQHPSRFLAHVGGAFVPAGGGLSAADVGQIMADCANL